MKTAIAVTVAIAAAWWLLNRSPFTDRRSLREIGGWRAWWEQTKYTILRPWNRKGR